MITVALDGAGEALGPISSNDVVYFHHWGTVVFGGQPVGTFVIRRESPQIPASGGFYPTQWVSIAISVSGFAGVLMMQGAIASAGDVSYVGNATVVPAGLDFTLSRVPVAGFQVGELTLRY